MVASFFLPLVLRCFFSKLVGVIASAILRDTIEYVLMNFTVLSLLNISSNTGSFYESEE